MTPSLSRSHSRSGLLLFAILLVTVTLALVALIAWITASHWFNEKRFVCTPWEASWWSPIAGAAQPAQDKAGALAKDASEASKVVEEQVWGKDGLIQQAEQWWKGRHAEDSKAPTAPAPAASTTTSPAPESRPQITSLRTPAPVAARPLHQREAELTQAEDFFATGMDHYRQANPRAGASVEGRVEHLRAAASAFAQADNLLSNAVPAYGKEPDHNPTRLADAEALQRYNRTLFETCKKSEAAALGY